MQKLKMTMPNLVDIWKGRVCNVYILNNLNEIKRSISPRQRYDFAYTAQATSIDIYRAQDQEEQGIAIVPAEVWFVLLYTNPVIVVSLFNK